MSNGTDDKFRSRKWILSRVLVLIAVLQGNAVLAMTGILMMMGLVPKTTETWTQSLMFGLGFMGAVLGWTAAAYLGANVAEKGWLAWANGRENK